MYPPPRQIQRRFMRIVQLHEMRLLKRAGEAGIALRAEPVYMYALCASVMESAPGLRMMLMGISVENGAAWR
ncbi:hypothetical protein COO59_02655 [Mixta theicola]|uniref:Uncharacterized protein n=1 Tax=Mixta theicola TaxID=1458355 RepID=A0A2K1QCT1_9GAMM|nr:hypothetical protein COO59_02655 [Mixta theicola]